MVEKLRDQWLDPDYGVKEKTFCICDHCGNEIYIGEDYYDYEGSCYHEDCFKEYMRDEYLRTAGDDIDD